MAARTALGNRTTEDAPPGLSRGRRAARRTALLAAALLLGITAACDSSSDDDSRRDPPDGGGTPTQSGSPFTGVPGKSGPVLGVKIDNAPAARPPAGLDRADVVFVEQVEGGSSRLLAVFSQQLPDSVGPVRSARESDIELLAQFGRPALSYSGIRSALQDDLREAPVRRVPPSDVPSAYSRSDTRAAPHNLFLDPADALRAAPDASAPRDIGFRFGAAPKGGEPTARETVRYPAASFTFDWSAQERRWLVSMDGSASRTADGERLDAPTVVVQEVTVKSSQYRDVAGAPTPYIETVGQGDATVLRDGKAYRSEWKRPEAEAGTSYTLPDGKRMLFARGPVWVVYTAR